MLSLVSRIRTGETFNIIFVDQERIFMTEDFDDYDLGYTDDEGDQLTVTLTLEDGGDVECLVLTIFEAAGRDYIALLPLEGEAAEDGEVFLYRYVEDEEGNSDIENIDSDEEYDIASDAFDELLDDEEFDDFIEEDIDEDFDDDIDEDD